MQRVKINQLPETTNGLQELEEKELNKIKGGGFFPVGVPFGFGIPFGFPFFVGRKGKFKFEIK
ncbi:MAG: bacteriocin [Hydrococcus sp. C42_A2020_068]|uniref:bacteriocin n=1 Tax=Pleurocapsa sp. PCC 7327 TaxID=118163 RepID=UPI00029FC046|nr:bacteriocin [Pleurocapsa sp. PCC 7327]AFY78105.1 hypothetical protein Ple7327_2847 [Pleurocapsa sp. PCC 7327]MBF2020222.1 bacteriocin [Hydrococcus sp. C42_A2020_068]